MNQKSEEGLFQVLEKILKEADQPLDCVEIYDGSMEVRKHAANPNRVSDYLGNMWRKGQLLRLPAPKGEGKKARWLYAWKGKAPAPKPSVDRGIAFDREVHTLLHKPHMHIDDDGRLITITLPGTVITIRHTEEN